MLAAAAVTRQLPPAVDRPSRAAHWTPRQVFRQSWTPRLAAAVAVVSLAVAVALGAVGLHTRRELDSARAQNQALAAVLAAPDARIMTEAVTNGGTATVVVSRVERKLVFTTSGLPRLPGSKVYELWLMGPPRIRRAGLLPAPASGRTAPVLASGLAAGDSVGVTVEPGWRDQPADDHAHRGHVPADLTTGPAPPMAARLGRWPSARRWAGGHAFRPGGSSSAMR